MRNKTTPLQEIILDIRTKMFYVCSCLSLNPGAWLASRPVTGRQVRLSVRVLNGRTLNRGAGVS